MIFLVIGEDVHVKHIVARCATMEEAQAERRRRQLAEPDLRWTVEVLRLNERQSA